MDLEKAQEIIKTASSFASNGLLPSEIYKAMGYEEGHAAGQSKALTPQPIADAPKEGYYTGLHFLEGTTEAPAVMHSARYYEGQGKHLFTGDNFKAEPNYWLPTISLRKGN